jgi:hypothetical protein
LPNESFDPSFGGQALETTYFDTAAYDLRKARLSKSRYLTLRIRCYKSPDGDYSYALSAKTDVKKWRTELTSGHAELLLSDGATPATDLPAHLQACLTELGADALVPVVTVCCRRYAVEDDQDRLTLDCCVDTDRAKHLGYSVLEYKSTNPATPLGRLTRLGLEPLNLSKFLWATEV